MRGERCPVVGESIRRQTSGCALATFGLPPQPSCLAPNQQSTSKGIHAEEHRTLTDLLATSEQTACPLNPHRNPTDEEVLAAALGAPARRVLMRAEMSGPNTGWRDGHLSVAHGFCPPDPSASPAALDASSGINLVRLLSPFRKGLVRFVQQLARICQSRQSKRTYNETSQRGHQVYSRRCIVGRCGLSWYTSAHLSLRGEV